MTTLAEVLREHDIASSETQVAVELRVLLGPVQPRGGTALTVDEELFLARHAGVLAASDEQLGTVETRSTARAVAEAAESLSRVQVADLLGTDVTRVSHRTRLGSLYSYAGASGRRRYPGWQFVGGQAVPHLSVVLEALPGGTHPVTVRSFFTTPDDALLLNGRPVSPADWLTSGGRPEPIAELARTLGEQV